ncbi:MULTISPECIES: tail fiber assembly protein [unclassified Providencia]|uniref:tail fiber assembly protein n=1 Tax=unclassified Providencia TaxID=2633465 RepID=UPI0013E026ED|nr:MULTISPECIES: tail fiber assembly protein [unclassified Providencia]EJD6474338.1 tail fiber assembly protein [Providencia rettgeri]ELU1435841.1 tail fiber assembly protein [Providencia rettgeri]QIF58001.1 tail fiber assembly protein [Providencia sp. 1701011]QIF62038.1 tail fiber assembly protein [Providencia sp. 1701091]HEM6888760.1 tail fiber assembly protein [Providencia rettgeri]
MKYYIDINNTVFAYSADGSQDNLISDALIEITEKKALEIANPPPSKQQLIAEAEYQKQALLNEATAAIAPLQDAVDLGIATDEEREQLRTWKEYRVQVNRVDVGLGMSVNWPVSPK